jgi:hypothetical protein
MPPLALTDSQISAIMALAHPLSPDQRSRFLEMLATRLNGRGEIGDGTLYQLCRELQRQHFSPPSFDRDTGGQYDRVCRRARLVLSKRSREKGGKNQAYLRAEIGTTDKQLQQRLAQDLTADPSVTAAAGHPRDDLDAPEAT